MDEIPIDGTLNDSEEKLERLRNITEMFSGKTNDEPKSQLNDEEKAEILSSSEKIRRTFQKFEEFVSSNGQIESDEDDDSPIGADGKRRSSTKRRTTKEHIPYHEMAEVKDKFEKGLIDSNKVRVEKRLDIRVQTGLASSKKRAFEQGTIEQENENQKQKTPIENDLVIGLTSTQKKLFEQQQNETTQRRTSNVVEHELLIGAARDKKAQFENVSNFERTKISSKDEEIRNFAGSGLAQAKRDELLSKIDAESNQRTSTRPPDIDPEQGIATIRRDQLESLANSQFKFNEKIIDVTAGLATTIKEQYIADTNRSIGSSSSEPIDVETGIAKNLATVFEKQDENFVKRSVEIEPDLLDCSVAKERVAMFKNLQMASQTSTNGNSTDGKIRIDENGNVVRETDKKEEIYFEKGQTKQLVEQWKNKKISPERETIDAQNEILQQGKAKNLVEMWKNFDKENSPPANRAPPRPMTPPADDSRRFSTSNEDENETNGEEKIPIELGFAKAAREKLLQSAELGTKRSSRQITPPPLSSDEVRRKFSATNDEIRSQIENSIFNEEFLPSKGQAKSLKNRFIELEQDARKVETAASKIKYVPKRFVEKPATKSTSQKPKETMENGQNHFYLSSNSS